MKEDEKEKSQELMAMNYFDALHLSPMEREEDDNHNQENSLTEGNHPQEDNSFRESTKHPFMKDFFIINTSDVGFEAPLSPTKEGIIFSILHVILVAAVILLIKVSINLGTTPYELIYSQGIIGIPLSLIYLKARHTYLFQVESNSTAKVLFTGLLGLFGLSGFYTSILLLSLSEALVLECLSYIFVTVIIWMMFNEKIHGIQFLGYISLIVGLVFFIQPTILFEEDGVHNSGKFFWGTLAGIAGSLFSCFYYCFIRKTYKKVKFIISTTYMYFIFCLFSPILILANYDYRNAPSTYSYETIGLMVSIGVGNWMSYWALDRALEYEKLISRVVSFKYLIFIGLVSINIWVLNESYNLATYIGFILIVGVNFILGMWKLFHNSY